VQSACSNYTAIHSLVAAEVTEAMSITASPIHHQSSEVPLYLRKNLL